MVRKVYFDEKIFKDKKSKQTDEFDITQDKSSKETEKAIDKIIVTITYNKDCELDEYDLAGLNLTDEQKQIAIKHGIRAEILKNWGYVSRKFSEDIAKLAKIVEKKDWKKGWKKKRFYE